MRRSTIWFRVFSRSASCGQDPSGVDGNAAARPDDINEKRARRPRDWSAICLTALRFLQFAYFAFAYHSLHAFQRSSFFREDGPWQHSPDQMRHSRQMMRWIRTQASAILIYHTVVLVVPWLSWALRSPSRPFARLATVFGDGCAMVAVFNSMVLLDGAHEGYCHSPPPRADFDLHGMFSFGDRGSHPHNMSRHRRVCRSLDVVFGLCGLVVLSHLFTAGITAWHAKRTFPLVSAKLEAPEDVEQGVVIEHRIRPSGHAETPSHRPPTSSRRQHSPPPPYIPVVPEPAQEHPSYATATDSRGRTSVETTASSIGIDGYLVPDGWRAPEQPPQYSSRPPSLHDAAL